VLLWIKEFVPAEPSPFNHNPDCRGTDRPADEEEASFSMSHETPPDKDTDLFNVADRLIRSQVTKIDVPLFGSLSFDESENEEGTESEPDNDESEVSDFGDDIDSVYEMPNDKDDKDVVNADSSGQAFEEAGSENVLVGSGKTSRQHRSHRSEI
jgi:hypothetical protein